MQNFFFKLCFLIIYVSIFVKFLHFPLPSSFQPFMGAVADLQYFSTLRYKCDEPEESFMRCITFHSWVLNQEAIMKILPRHNFVWVVNEQGREEKRPNLREQRRLRSACASAQSDQSLLCLHKKDGSWDLFIKPTPRLIRNLCRYASRYETS